MIFEKKAWWKNQFGNIAVWFLGVCFRYANTAIHSAQPVVCLSQFCPGDVKHIKEYLFLFCCTDVVMYCDYNYVVLQN